MKIWKENPVLGVGPGLSSRFRFRWLGDRVGAHTEYTRALAEHGAFGAAAVMIILLIVWRSYLAAPGIFARSWVAIFSVWALASMMHASMRIAAFSFVLAMASVRWPRPRLSPPVQPGRRPATASQQGPRPPKPGHPSVVS